MAAETKQNQVIAIQGQVRGQFVERDKRVAVQQEMLLFGARRQQTVDRVVFFLQLGQRMGLLVGK